MKKFIISIGIIALIAGGFASSAFANKPEAYSKTICHHTPAHNVTLTFNNLQSYLGHLGTPHSGSTYDTNGACQKPEVTPTAIPTAVPTATPEPEPTTVPTVIPTVTEVPGGGDDCEPKVLHIWIWDIPLPNDCEEDGGGEPTVTPSPQPEPQPSVEPVDEPTATPSAESTNTSTGEGSPATATCTETIKSPLLQGVERVSPTSVKFSWWGVEGADKYAIVYGYSQDKLEFGQVDIPGNQTSVVVNELQPGAQVFAKVSAYKGVCGSTSNVLPSGPPATGRGN